MPRYNRYGRPPCPRRAVILAAAAALAIAFCDGRRRCDTGATLPSPHAPLLDRLEKIERGLATLGDGMIPARDARDRLALDSVINRFVHGCAAEKAGEAHAARSLVSYIFDTLGIRFDTARSAIENILPAPVARGRRGSCLGISALMLVIAERCGIPLRGVLVPGHFFVRFDNGNERINIETMKEGRAMPDAWYARRFGVPDPPGCYLRNLTEEQTAAVVLYNIGTFFLARKKIAASIAYFKQSLSMLPAFADAQGNFAIALAGQGTFDSALAVLSGLKAAYPDFKNIDATMGNLFLGKGDHETALRHFGFALEREPRDAAALFGAGISCFHLRRFLDAERLLRRAIAARPDFPEAKEALDRTVAKLHGRNQ